MLPPAPQYKEEHMMKKQLALILTAVMMLGLLAGCGI